MAIFDSRRSRFFINDAGGTERDLSAYITKISGLPGNRALDEVTSLSDSGRKFIPGLEECSISITGMFDNTASAGPDAVLGPLCGHASAVEFSYEPYADVGSGVRYSGRCWVESYDISSSLGSWVRFTATLRVDGAVARGAY